MHKIIPLQNAFAQTVRDQDADKWIVYDDHQNKIAELPARLTEQEAMDVLRFGRYFEIQAFNDGVAEGLERGKKAANIRVDTLIKQMDELANENERLAKLLNEIHGE